MIIIEEKQIEKTVTMSMALPIFRKAYEDCVKGYIYAGDRIVMPIRGEENCAQWLVACCTNVPIFGSKFASVFPGNVSKGMPSVLSQISLYSAETGELLALLDANYLTAIKTGGSAAIATDLMANKDASKLGIIGTGMQAFTQVLGIQEVRDLTELRVFDMNKERVLQFVEKVKKVQNHPYKIIAESSADECVAASEIICTCTPSLTPVFNGDAIKLGTHINAIGSFTPFMQEIDDTAVIRAQKVVTEHVEGIWAAAGDILIPFNKGLFGKEKVNGSIGEVLTGKIPGRETRDEITLYESVGSCVLDIAIAIAVYDILK
ncbi:MAG: ornithine cyclodeaminase family protein [Synergistota bacterium]|nr:ornithine cyclodeaminase family protein [Synergistota bacterium]